MTGDLWRRARELEERNAAATASAAAADEARIEAEEAARKRIEEAKRKQFADRTAGMRRQLSEVGAFAAQYLPSRGVQPTEFRDEEDRYNIDPSGGTGWEINGACISEDGSWWHKTEEFGHVTWKCQTVEDVIESLSRYASFKINNDWNLGYNTLGPDSEAEPLHVWTNYAWVGNQVEHVDLGLYEDVLVEFMVDLGDRSQAAPPEE